ncbi:MAG: AMP-binding protein, partial [Acidimicrobiales bacterium]|nr:AMP-binding protein [Acidimicrobiales bacterium]
MISSVDPACFASSWEQTVSRRPDATFLVFEGVNGTTCSWTYGEFDLVVGQVAAKLIANGVDHGSAVHMALSNCPAFVAVWLATIRLGAWVVPSDPMATESELRNHLERTKPVVGLCASSRSEIYRASCGVLSVIEVDELDSTLKVFEGSPLRSWPEPKPSDRAAVMFTSGTTGRPKGVEVTQANYAFAGHTMAAAAHLQESDRQLVVLPLFHANAQYYSFAPAISVGASVALMASFTASGFLDQAVRHGATTASLFAAPMRMILARGKPVEGLRLRHCWFAQNLADDQYEVIAKWLGCRPRQLYGMTETIPAVLTNDPTDPVSSSMGRPTGGCVVDLQRADGTSVDVGEVGEIVVGGKPGKALFAGYLDAPEVTGASFRDGWFLTGDRAVRDKTGRYYFDGRSSDVLKVSGENVSVVEVEAVLSSHPKVLEAAVVGRADPIRDEVPVAFVVPVSSTISLNPAELLEWCSTQMSKAKLPQSITVLNELPRTSVGKIRKFALKEEV